MLQTKEYGSANALNKKLCIFIFAVFFLTCHLVMQCTFKMSYVPRCDISTSTDNGVLIEISDQIEELYSSSNNMLQYEHLPSLTKWSMAQFTEVTTANRDESIPLYPDFNFFTDYGEDHLVIYEAYNPGCIFRFYLKPDEKHLKTQYISFNTDGRTFNYTLTEMAQADRFPFLKPLSVAHKQVLQSGVAFYQPICYRQYLKITYHFDFKLPKNLLQENIHCCHDALKCRHKAYVGISRYIFPIGTTVKSFESFQKTEERLQSRILKVQQYANALKFPEIIGPDKFEKCDLTCLQIFKNNEKQVLFDHQGSLVITALKIRLFTKSTEGKYELSQNWNDILITIIFDGSDLKDAQVKDVPLGSLYGVIGTLTNISSAMIGLQNKNCTYQSGDEHHFPEITKTGYFYFPMPFWKNAKILVKLFNESYVFNQDLHLCYQITTTRNSYNQKTNGHFHIQQSYFGSSFDRWRNILTVEKGHGKIVAVFTNGDNFRILESKRYFLFLESDHVIFLDGRKEASMQGTGCEDYFSCGHGCFHESDNTSYAFVGYYQGSNKKRLVNNSKHFYRFHLFDPIPFHSSIFFFSEGCSKLKHHLPETTISYTEYRKLLSKNKPSSSHTAFWYGRKDSDFTMLDFIDIGNKTSEKIHSLKTDRRSLNKTLQLKKKKFIGQRTSKLLYDVNYRTIISSITFTLKHNPKYQYLMLRRQFYNPILVWKQDAFLTINGMFYMRWHLAMGSTADPYVLREDDIVINTSHETVRDAACLLIKVQPITEWHDIRYELYGFQMKDN